jgi:hypothetical protein
MCFFNLGEFQMTCDMVMAIIIIPVVTICQKMAHRQTMGSPLDTTNPDKQTSDTTNPALDKIRPRHDKLWN